MGHRIWIFILILTLGHSRSFAEVLNIEDTFHPHYAQCVSWGINHPLRKLAQGENSETSMRFLESLHGFCQCKRGVDQIEIEKSKKQSLGYFFSGREGYFSSLDQCLQNQVAAEEFETFFSMTFYDHLNPLTLSLIKGQEQQGLERIVGREIASAQNECLNFELIRECRKISSLYFTYLCLRKKVKNIEYMEKLKETCNKKDIWDGDLI